MRAFIVVLLFFLSLLGVVSARAQQQPKLPVEFVKAELTEIENKARVFINAASDVQKENIARALGKQSALRLVDDPAQADYVIAYRIERERVGVTIGGAGTTLQNDWAYFGRMIVYLPPKDGLPRKVWETRLRFQVPPPSNRSPLPDWRRNWEQPLEKSAIAKFIKALNKVRAGDK
jgi:hypothetical protein